MFLEAKYDVNNSNHIKYIHYTILIDITGVLHALIFSVLVKYIVCNKDDVKNVNDIISINIT